MATAPPPATHRTPPTGRLTVTTLVTAAVREKVGQVNGVLHFAGDGAELARLVKPGGRLASTLSFSGDELDQVDVTVTAIMANPGSDTLASIARAAADGTVPVPITRTYDLEDLPQRLHRTVRRPATRRAIGLDGFAV